MPRARKCHHCGLPCQGGGLVVTDGVRRSVCGACLPEVAPALVRLQHDRPAIERVMERTYGFDVARYERLAIQQGGRCAICRKRPSSERRLAIDHDHATGDVRGLLCDRCNTALGGFADDIGNLARAIAYLTEPPAREG